MSETVRISLNGSYDGGRTSQAFLIEQPNGVANAQHNIDIEGRVINRITDTNIDNPNIATTVRGKYSKIQDTSVAQLTGDSEINIDYGVATPSPPLEVESGTTVVYRRATRRGKTGPNGQVDIDWSDAFAFGDEPLINITTTQAVHDYVESYDTNANGRFIGATIQITDPSGTPVGNNVDVNAKIMST